MSSLLLVFAPADKSTALLHLGALVCFVLAALSIGSSGRRGSTGLVGLGLALYIFPGVWNTLDAAFR